MSSDKIITVQFVPTSKTPTEASMLEICALVYILFGIYYLFERDYFCWFIELKKMNRIKIQLYIKKEKEKEVKF